MLDKLMIARCYRRNLRTEPKRGEGDFHNSEEREVSTRDVREKERREASGMEKECFGIPVAIAWRESFFSQRRETLHIWPAVDRGWTLIV